jgi:hypothetical protein
MKLNKYQVIWLLDKMFEVFEAADYDKNSDYGGNRFPAIRRKAEELVEEFNDLSDETPKTDHQ